MPGGNLRERRLYLEPRPGLWCFACTVHRRRSRSAPIVGRTDPDGRRSIAGHTAGKVVYRQWFTGRRDDGVQPDERDGHRFRVGGIEPRALISVGQVDVFRLLSINPGRRLLARLTVGRGEPPQYPAGYPMALAPFASVGTYPRDVQRGAKFWALFYLLSVLVAAWVLGGRWPLQLASVFWVFSPPFVPLFGLFYAWRRRREAVGRYALIVTVLSLVVFERTSFRKPDSSRSDDRLTVLASVWLAELATALRGRWRRTRHAPTHQPPGRGIRVP
jgi:hypothetical protein